MADAARIEESTPPPQPKGKAKKPPKAKKTKRPKPPKLKRPKVPLRQRLTITTMLLFTVMASITLAGAIAGGYALSIVYKEKLSDTWAILFLELESHGNRLVQKLEDFQQNNLTGSGVIQPNGLLKIEGSTGLRSVFGQFPDSLTAGDLRLRSTTMEHKWNILKYQGEELLAVTTSAGTASRLMSRRLPQGNYLALWNIEVPQWFADSNKVAGINTLYVLTKEGRLLFTNEPTITETNFVQRPLVQQFIKNPLNQGQLEFDSAEGDAYGFFYEVPQTNIVMFVETLKSVAMAPVYDLALHYLIVLGFIIGIAGLLLQFPLSNLVAPMRELVRLAAEIGAGNFNARPKQQGFGELKVLSTSFTEMSKSLLLRDEKINMLLIEQQEKLRMVNELAIATNIQNNFLFRDPLPMEAKVEIAAHYAPAAEVAGDWYGYFYNPLSKETVFAIADVSGHGAGSAMFTAIIAATFEETRAQAADLDSFPMEDLARRLNRLIFKLGQGQFHATMLMGKLKAGQPELELMNAGHTFPLLISPNPENTPEPIMMRSDVLGLSMDFLPVMKKVPFNEGTALLAYTDGLIEGAPDNRLYRDRRLFKMAKVEPHQSINFLIERVYEDWLEYLKGQAAQDDLCLMGIRAVS